MGRRILLLSLSLFLFQGILFVRLFYLQFLHFDRFDQKAERQHRIKVKLPPTRGDILDRHREPLALSVMAKSIFADPARVVDPTETALQLAPLLNLNVEKLEKRLSRKKRFVWLKRKVDESLAEEIKALDIDGIYFMEEPKRFYPKGNLLSHLLGFVGMDNEGLEGLEKQYDEYLKGKPGYRVTGRDRKGREVITLRDEDVSPVNGYQLVLTIDELIQHIAEKELQLAFEEHKAKSAMIVVLNPKTGELLACANRPTFNPNKISGSTRGARRNRVVTDYFEPGSTFKVITATAALDKGVTTLDEEIFCENGALWHAGHVLNDSHPLGTVTFREVIEKSSNIGTAKVAIRLGPSDLYMYIRRFGFGSRTGSGLLGEISGVVHPPKKWSRYSIVAIPMGQEVGVTALQITSAIAAMANNGVLMKPQFIRRIVNEEGSVIQHFEPQVVRQVVRPEIAQQVTDVLIGVTTRKGTAYRARVPGYLVAGKTGTAQKAVPGQGYVPGKYVSSFVGYVPADDPQLCIGVFVDEPQGAYYGGLVAAPVFARVAEQSLKTLNILPDPSIEQGGSREANQ